MTAIVGIPLLLLAALNLPATARAADRCLRFGEEGSPPQALVVARPHVPLRRAVLRGTQDGRGPVVVRPSGPCATTFVVGDGRLWVDGWSGTIRSRSTRIDGLVAASDIADAVHGSDVLRPGGHADVARLDARLHDAQDARVPARIALGAIMLALLWAAPRRVLMAGPAAIAAALALSAYGSTSVSVFALATFVGAFLPVEALWLFFAAYLVVLAAFPATASLAILGPHPLGGGRFYGMTNEVETLVLGPALLLGLVAAPLVLATVAWSRAGADGGGALVFLAAYAALLPRPSNRMALAYAGAVVAVAVALVGVDAATGGSSHVTKTLGDGPGAVWHALTHRWSTSWHGATANPGRLALFALCAGGLVWAATRTPRDRVVDALLVGIAVSLVVNDTPQDVVLWGSLQAVALRRAL